MRSTPHTEISNNGVAPKNFRTEHVHTLLNFRYQCGSNTKSTHHQHASLTTANKPLPWYPEKKKQAASQAHQKVVDGVFVDAPSTSGRTHVTGNVNQTKKIIISKLKERLGLERVGERYT